MSISRSWTLSDGYVEPSDQDSGSVLIWILRILIFLVAFAVVAEARPVTDTIGIHSQSSRAADYQLKFQPVRIVKGIPIGVMPVCVINQPFNFVESSKQVLPVPFVVSPYRVKKPISESGPKSARGFSQVILHGLHVSNWINSEFANHCPSEVIGWGLSAVNQFHLGLHSAVFMKDQMGIPHYHVCPQLPFRGSLLQRESFIRRPYCDLSSFRRLARLAALPRDADKRQKDQQGGNTIRPCDGFHDPEFRAFGLVCFAGALIWLVLDPNRRRGLACAILLALIAWVCIAGHTENCEQNQQQRKDGPIGLQHNSITVSQKHLTERILL